MVLDDLFCKECNNFFGSEEGLCNHVSASHMRTYVENKDIMWSYTCSLCGLSLYSLHDDKEHLNNHDTGSPSNCNICGEMFKLPSDLKDHMKSLHEEKLLPPADPQFPEGFPCPQCEHSFNDIGEHIICHEPNFFFSCEFCEVFFTSIQMHESRMVSKHEHSSQRYL